MQRMRRKDANRRETNPGQHEQSGYPGQCDHASDNGSRCKHDRDLERRGRQFKVMIFFHCQVARELGMLGAFDELFLSFAGFGFRNDSAQRSFASPRSAFAALPWSPRLWPAGE
jgi:hypothetical protein